MLTFTLGVFKAHFTAFNRYRMIVGFLFGQIVKKEELRGTKDVNSL